MGNDEREAWRMARLPRTGALSFGLMAAVASAPAALSAQGVRGWAGTTIQMVELRPLGLDTLLRAAVEQQEDGTYLFGDRPVFCGDADLCTVYTTRPEDRAVAATQDVSLTAWGFGVQGLSFTALLRARTRLGSDFVWPRTDDEFDALLGYAQLVRGPLRVRVGRQEIRSGLGFPAFDGGSASYRAGVLRVEAYGGRSLARGLREPANDALKGLEDFLPDKSVYLVGGSAEAQLSATSLTARYQREVLADRSGLVSERAALDFSASTRGARVTGSLDYDLAFRRLGKSHLTVSLPISQGRWLVEATGRRYLPYFSLSTIWGIFEPVAYSEVELRSAWAPGGSFGAWLSGGWRRYDDTETTVILRPLRDDGWRAGAGLRWRARETWLLQGSYRLEMGPGATLSSGDVSARYRQSDRLFWTATATAFQQIEEFRLGDGRALGAGLAFDLGVSERVTLSGGLSVLRHRTEGSPADSPWNQARGWTSLRIGIGNDPGLTTRRQP